MMAGLISSISAQEVYPTRPITIIVPYGPGSGTDVGARVIAPRLGEVLGQPVVIENKAGANGSIGAVAAARAKPDGYTLFMGTSSTHAANPALEREMSYDAIKDFAPISCVGLSTNMIVVNSGVPVKNMQELINYGKANELSVATGNTISIVMSETLGQLAGVKLLIVPFKSNPDAAREVVAGRVNMMFTDVTGAFPHVTAGALRPIAVTSRQRSELMPEVPTIVEGGVKSYPDVSGWIGLFAPAGTPPVVIDRLNAAVVKVLQAPDIRARLLELRTTPCPMAAAEYATWIRGEATKWKEMVQISGVKPQ